VLSQILLYALSAGAGIASSLWLAIWSNEGSSDDAKPVSYYISIYVVLSVTQAFANYVANFVGFRGAVASSRSLHAQLVETLLRCPMGFFDATPLGACT
jgi:ABC-type multidrug transport system fused ATPase/permease subunit